MVRVLFYIPSDARAKRLIKQSSELFTLSTNAEICRTLESLSSRLVHMGSHPDIAVLLATSQKELSNIYSIRQLLADIRIILILPDRQPETISKGHKLYPRFLSYTDGSFKDIAAVLEKMLTIYRSKQPTIRQPNNTTFN